MLVLLFVALSQALCPTTSSQCVTQGPWLVTVVLVLFLTALKELARCG